MLALPYTSTPDEAITVAAGLVEAAEVSRNPYALSFALLASGLAVRHADPDRALGALRRGLVVAQDSGNCYHRDPPDDTVWPYSKPNSGDPLAALGYFPVAIRNLHDSGNTANMRASLTALAACLGSARTLRTGGHDRRVRVRLAHHRGVVPEINTAIAHLRDVLGDQTYESLARQGKTTTTAEMVTYAYDQIDQARAELNAVSK